MKKEKKVKKKKKKILIICILLVVLLIIIGISAFLFYRSKKLKVILTKELQANIYEEKYNTDYIKKIVNGKVISKKEKIKTNKLGPKKIVIKVENFFHKKIDYTYNIDIVDKEKPVITHKDRFETESGTEVNLLEEVTVTDNSKEEIKVEIEGTYDFNTSGTYELEYVAKDSSGNETREKFVLEVKEKKVIPTEGYIAPNREFTTSKGFKGVVRDGVTYIDGVLIANKTYSLPSSFNPGGLTSEFMNNFNNMKSAANAEGIDFDIFSGFRSYYTQKSTYQGWVNKDGQAAADTYSARAGHSEHQSGLAADINGYGARFDESDATRWMANNCYKYGFILRYPEGKQGITGYVYESWHFRYVGTDLATKLYNGGNWITLEEYFGITSEYTY